MTEEKCVFCPNRNPDVALWWMQRGAHVVIAHLACGVDRGYTT